MNHQDIVKALEIVAPGSEWHLSGQTYDDLVWLDDSVKPTKQQLENALKQ